MNTVQKLESNPFALMTDPDAILAALAGSDRLARLKSRICRPLDKPLVTPDDDDAAALDAALNAATERDRDGQFE